MGMRYSSTNKHNTTSLPHVNKKMVQRKNSVRTNSNKRLFFMKEKYQVEVKAK